jgi:hypothetical protein
MLAMPMTLFVHHRQTKPFRVWYATSQGQIDAALHDAKVMLADTSLAPLGYGIVRVDGVMEITQVGTEVRLAFKQADTGEVINIEPDREPSGGRVH